MSFAVCSLAQSLSIISFRLSFARVNCRVVFFFTPVLHNLHVNVQLVRHQLQMVPQWKSAASRRRVKKLFHRNKGLEVSTEHKIPMEWSFFFFLQIIKTKNEQEKYVLARGKKGMRMRGSQENSSWRWNYFVVVDCNAELMNLQREHFYSICFSFLSFWGTKKKTGFTTLRARTIDSIPQPHQCRKDQRRFIPFDKI